MAKLYFNSRDELICVDSEKIAFVQADGNYSRIMYVNKREVHLTIGISKLEETLMQLKGKYNRFVRLGRSLIINHAYLSKIDVLKQILILSDVTNDDIRIRISKNILKTYKKTISASVKNNDFKSHDEENSNDR